MDTLFSSDEELLRAVWPPETYSWLWEKNGRLSSAAFKDRKGLSVDRTGGRPLDEAIDFIKQSKQGYVFDIPVVECRKAKTYLVYLPGGDNPYHSEIHQSRKEVVLSDEQALYLSRVAIKVADP